MHSRTAGLQGGHSSTIQLCAAEGDLDGVKRLLNLGEDVDGVDEDGNTALHFAAEVGSAEVTRLLLERSADANVGNDEGDRPLHKATINNHVDIVALLVAGGADPNAQVQISLPLLLFRRNHWGVSHWFSA